MRLTQNQLYRALQEHDDIVKLYRREYPKDNKRDWRTYEQRLALRIKKASIELEKVIQEAHSMIKISKNSRGRPEDVPITKKVMILLIKDIFQLSNRKMANMLAMFTALTGIELSYKSVERIYSNEFARIIIHNMFVLLVNRKGIKDADVSGDGTGYSLTITKHYRNERCKELKRLNNSDEKASNKNAKKKLFVYAFGLIDLDSGMYIGYGTSMKSEKEAFREAVSMAKGICIHIDSARLDRLYSVQSITKELDNDTIIYIIPRKNATIRGSPEWKHILRSYVNNPISHLQEYYRREKSESGFSADKRLCGWKVWQRRDDRIDTALLCKGIWHNLMLMC